MDQDITNATDGVNGTGVDMAEWVDMNGTTGLNNHLRFQIEYYLQGVILMPVAILGMIGK